MANDAEVKLGANTGGLDAGLRNATAATKESFKSISDSLREVQAGSSSFEEAVGSAGRTVIEHFRKMAAEAVVMRTGIGLAFTGIAAGAAAALAAMGGSLLLAIKGIDDLKEEAHAVNELRSVFGMTSAEASRLSVALQLMGKTSGDYSSLAMHLARAVKMDEERLQALGMKTRDAHGNLKPLQELMQEAIGTMETYRAGVDQDLVATEAFGRSAREVYEYVENFGEANKRAGELVGQLGIQMGPEKREQIKAYQLEVRAMGVVWNEVRQSLGEALMPVLKTLVQWLASIGPSAAETMGTALRVLITVAEVFATAMGATIRYVISLFEKLMAIVHGVGDVMAAFFRRDFAAIPGIVNRAFNEMNAAAEKAAKGTQDSWTASYNRIKNLWATPPGLSSGGGGAGDRATGGTRGWTAKATGTDKSRVSEWETQLKAERDAFERMKLDQGSFERWSESQTSEFWERIKATYTLNTKELNEVNAKWYDAQREVRTKAFEATIAGLEREKDAIKFNYDERVRIAQQQAAMIAQAYGAGSKEAMAAEARVTAEMQRQADQRVRIAEIEAAKMQTRAEHEVTMEQLAAQQKQALNQISAAQAIAMEQAAEERLFQIKREYMEKARALHADDPVYQAKIDADLEALEQEHQRKITEIQNKAVLEREQYALQAQDEIRANMAGFLSSLAGNIRNAKQIFLDFLKSIDQTLRDLAAKQLVKQIFGAGTEGGDIISKITGLFTGSTNIGGAAGGAAGAAQQTAAATALTGSATALTGAATLETTAATEMTVAGTMLTAAATELTAAATELMMSAAAGAIGGGMGDMFLGFMDHGSTYVPRDGLAFIHKGEAVVPSSINPGIFANAGRPTAVHNSFHFAGAVDTRTLAQVQASAYKGMYRVNQRDN